jgi:uncharacterized membrane protein YjgN (DUF898 family)
MTNEAEGGADALPGGAATAAVRELPVGFRGSGGEYFGIWIVNVLLSIVTLGIYSAWAKVRTQKYFCQCTTIDGAAFEYHGRPLAILIGRILAIAMLLAYRFAPHFGPFAAFAAALALAAVMPWLLHRSLRFRLQNLSYRGLRFRFAGTLGGAYQAFLLWPIFAIVTLGFGLPLAYQRIKRYQHNHSRFGGAPFSFDATAGSFYLVYLLAFVLLLLGVAAMVVAAGLLAPGAFAAAFHAFQEGGGKPSPEIAQALAVLMLFYVVFFVYASIGVGSFVQTRIQNLIWNHTRLGPHRIRSAMRTPRYAFIAFTNVLGIVFTLGLFKPFAVVRLLRYQLESATVLAAGSLEEFVAEQDAAVGALGMEGSDIFDFDIAL